MKIAIISDIHGNDYALKNVLNEIRAQNIKNIFVLGDLIGYYYNIKSILDLLSEFECTYIKGNHEEMLKLVLQKELDIEEVTRKYGSGIKKCIEDLTDNQIKMLINLDMVQEIKIDGLRIKLLHATCDNINEYIYPDKSEAILSKNVDADFDYVFFGHTHRTFIYKKENCTLVNTGSVGQNRESGGIATWVILNTENRVVQFKSTKYDTKELEEEVMKNDPSNEYLISVLRR